MNEQIRADFEEFAADVGFVLDQVFFADGNNYEDEETRLAFKIWQAAHARYAGSESEADKPSVSWGIDWGRDGDQSCACIMKHYVDGTKEIVSVEYSPAQPKVLDGLAGLLHGLIDVVYTYGLNADGEPLSKYKKLVDDAEALLSAQDNTRPAPAVPDVLTIRLGSYGKAFDAPTDRRAYTYAEQPNNNGASRIGQALSEAVKLPSGDWIDSGLCLLKTLQAHGFGVFEIDKAMLTQAKKERDK